MVRSLNLRYVILLFSFAMAAAAPVVFIEPEGAVQRATEGNDPTQIYRPVTDPSRIATYRRWLNNEAAGRGLRLFEQARSVAQSRHLPNIPSAYYVALIPGGNHAAIGFRLRNGSKIDDYPHTPFIKLEADPKPFEDTFLHETGHVILYLLNGARSFPGRDICSIPHSTAALTDRGTALSEGFAIHLETLNAHLSHNPETLAFYQHRRFRFGNFKTSQSEYFHSVADLLTFAQTFSRYQAVRDNAFAFESAFTGPDYLRVQLDPARDFSSLRNPDQLLQSEGFYATFFFSFIERGDDVNSEEVLRARYSKVFLALADMFATKTFDEDSPHLLHFVETYSALYPGEAGQVNDALLDLSHGVFVDRDAPRIWHDLYATAIRLDSDHLHLDRIEETRSGWQALVKDPKSLYSRIGAEIRCEVKGVPVQLVDFGDPTPLVFDVNTVPIGIMRMVPFITEQEIQRWLSEREIHPFANSADFQARASLNASSIGALDLRVQ